MPIKYLNLLGVTLCCLFASSSLFAAQKVTLQLKWEHEFQFAGYYAAKWQGFYADAGIEVEIKPAFTPDGQFIEVIQEIRDERAHFAIGALDILKERDYGTELVILAPIFQRPPTAIFSLADTKINNLTELAKLRIAVAPHDSSALELHALFKSRGFNYQNIQIVDQPVSVETLIADKADAIYTYEVSARIQAQERAVTLNKLNPSDYGLNFYGDTLYTTQKVVSEDPEMVRRFTEASIKGWQYALSNKQEIVERISNELPRHKIQYADFYSYNLAFAGLVDELMQYPLIPIGHSNPKKWYSMNERVRALGIVSKPLDTSGLLFDTSQHYIKSNNKFTLVICLLISSILIFVFWYRKQVVFTSLFILITAMVGEYHFEVEIKNESFQARQLALVRHLSSISAKLEGNLQNNLALLRGFAAYITAHPNLSAAEFDNYAREIFKKEPLLINFASAKNLIINYIYPLEGNERALGLDYNKTPEQREMVMQVANTGQLMVAGPLELVQGGTAFIGRAPIYTGDDNNRALWGIISAPIDAKKLFHQSNLKAQTSDVNIAIRSYNSRGHQGAVFFGDPLIFDSPAKVNFVINAGGGSWDIAAIAVGENEKLQQSLLLLRISFLVATSIVLAFTFIRFHQEKIKRVLEKTILSHQSLLEKVGIVAKIGGFKSDHRMNILQWSEQTSLALHRSQDFIPVNFDELAPLFVEDSFKELQRVFLLSVDNQSPFDLKLKLNCQNDQWVRIIASISEVSHGKPVITGTIQDISDEVQSKKLIEHQATYDSLTNLPNRLLFNDRLQRTISKSRRTETGIGVLFIDLDRFKPVNDNYGHQIGDQLLIEASKRILSCVRQSDTVSRLSGDEFGVILIDVESYEAILRVTEVMIEKLQAVYHVEKYAIHCSASIGISVFPSDGDDAQALIRKADQAMYEVKGSGRNGWQFYTKEMQEKSEYRHLRHHQLVVALEKAELVPYLQPIVSLNSLKTVKCEALARWPQTDGSFIPPDEFILLAEETGLVNKIDLFILQVAAANLIEINANTQNVELSINISPRLFHTKDNALKRWLKAIEHLSQFLSITVEITERLLIADSTKALEVLAQIKSLGVKIAFDDFGTGYSSLSYLVKFPVDIIKIDREFVARINQDEPSNALIETMLMMAKRLNIDVIAEGIETQAQLNFLTTHGCQFGQGYYLGKPMSIEAFSSLTRGVTNEIP